MNTVNIHTTLCLAKNLENLRTNQFVLYLSKHILLLTDIIVTLVTEHISVSKVTF